MILDIQLICIKSQNPKHIQTNKKYQIIMYQGKILELNPGHPAIK